MQRSTVGCQLCVQWIDVSTLRQSLKDLKESHQVETEEYAMHQDIDNYPAFNWWENAVLNKKMLIISLCQE